MIYGVIVMSEEENTNHILIEVLNNDGDLKLTKFRNPQAIWQNNDYPDEYIFRDIDIVNVFQLIQENKQLKDNWNTFKKWLENEVKRYKEDYENLLFSNVEYLTSAHILNKMIELDTPGNVDR